MCLLFFEVNQEPGPDEYQLVLASVRDEYYSRPTMVADFWSEHPSVIGGRDRQDGKEGGTWLAMNKSNHKLGVLLNILQPNYELESDKLGRGFIVNDYVTGTDSHGAYLDKLSAKASSYNGFLMIAMDIQNKGSFSVYSNSFNRPPKTFDTGIYGFGNNVIPNLPWPKVTHGRKRFESIVSGHRTIETKDQLVEDLFEMLADKTILPLDGQMLKQGDGRKIENLKKLNSLFVSIPDTKYGTRTWSLIIVDGLGNVDYIENTMKEPIVCTLKGVERPNWQLTKHRFAFD